MKRWLLPLGLLVVLLLLLLVGGYFAFLRFGKGGGASAAMIPVQTHLPADTIAFAWIPDVPKAQAELKTTGIWKLWKEPAFQQAVDGWLKDAVQGGASETLLEKDAESARGLFMGLLPLMKGQAFLSLGALRNGTPEGFAGGFEIGSDRAPFDAWVASTQKAFPTASWEKKDHGGIPYFVRSKLAPDVKEAFCVAVVKEWVLIGLGEQPFLNLVDRFGGAASGPSLAGIPAFKEQMDAQQGRPFVTFAYVNLAPLWDLVERETAQAKFNVKSLRSITSASFTSTIENGGFADHWYVAWPKAGRPPIGKQGDPVAFKTAPLLGSGTVVASFQNIDLPAMLAQVRADNPADAKKIDDGIAQINQFLAMSGLNLEKDILPSLGPEVCTSLTWGDSQPFPGLTLILEHKNQDALKKLVDMGVMFSGGAMEASTVAGQPAYIYRNGQLPAIQPGIWIGKDMLILTLHGDQFETLVKPSAAPLFESAPFTALRKRISFQKPISLAYLDTQRIFTKGYDLFVAYSPMIEAMSGVKLSGKLPPKDAILPHLGRSMAAAGLTDAGQSVEYVSEQGNPLYLVAFAAASGKLPLKVPATPPIPVPGMGPATESADPAEVLKELQLLDQTVTGWAQANQKAAGTKVAWVDIVDLLPADSPVVERAGLDPVGNAYLFTETGEHQVQLAPASVEALKDKITAGFWGKFAAEEKAPDQPPAAAIPTDPVPAPVETVPVQPEPAPEPAAPQPAPGA